MQNWKVDSCPDARGFFTIRPDDGTEFGDTDAQPIATVYVGEDADIAAAAPAMLAALEMALPHIPKNAMIYSEGTWGNRVYVADTVRAAIAQARGGAG